MQNLKEKYAQLNANSNWKVIEWIPNDRFKDIKKNKFGTIYYAKWIGGQINKWDIKNQQWKRWGNCIPETHPSMIVLEYAADGNHREYLKINLIGAFGSKIPETHPSMIVLEYAADGNHREYLKINLIGAFGSKNIFEVLPYIAPEILSGEEYTKALGKYAMDYDQKFHKLITRMIMRLRCLDAPVT
ncbi:hypothetical protein Glove_71g87 [Diversispora epigaea]|uniref:Protein kinase domain-containing protein n=1 Tax=Diversispora epigaea TaxID=1348612 RepID=A0A397JAW0_9GLOM|nr:hypothetical protein Glove_71g87 [Diversispora epigaea]